jgi:hypothetical protein
MTKKDYDNANDTLFMLSEAIRFVRLGIHGDYGKERKWEPYPKELSTRVDIAVEYVECKSIKK